MESYVYSRYMLVLPKHNGLSVLACVPTLKEHVVLTVIKVETQSHGLFLLKHHRMYMSGNTFSSFQFLQLISTSNVSKVNKSTACLTITARHMKDVEC